MLRQELDAAIQRLDRAADAICRAHDQCVSFNDTVTICLGASALGLGEAQFEFIGLDKAQTYRAWANTLRAAQSAADPQVLERAQEVLSAVRSEFRRRRA